MRACNGNRRSEALAEQIKKVSVSVPIEVDGWRLSNRQNIRGGLFFFLIQGKAIAEQLKIEKNKSSPDERKVENVWRDERKRREERPTESEEQNKENDRQRDRFIPLLFGLQIACFPLFKACPDFSSG
jgi:hypothetical protein